MLSQVPLHPHERYLDVGCGSGSIAWNIAATTQLHVTGIDIDAERIQKANARGKRPNLRFALMDATKLEFAEGAFDIVANSLVLHEIPGRGRAFAEMVRVLAAGGYLMVHDFARARWFPAKEILTVNALDEWGNRRACARCIAPEPGIARTGSGKRKGR